MSVSSTGTPVHALSHSWTRTCTSKYPPHKYMHTWGRSMCDTREKPTMWGWQLGILVRHLERIQFFQSSLAEYLGPYNYGVSQANSYGIETVLTVICSAHLHPLQGLCSLCFSLCPHPPLVSLVYRSLVLALRMGAYMFLNNVVRLFRFLRLGDERVSWTCTIATRLHKLSFLPLLTHSFCWWAVRVWQ